MKDPSTTFRSGFTLIELSIVLVIIGLIIGGILLGRDLIHAAEIRSQISQIQRYQLAVNTFKGKYNGLPGDIADPQASGFGFQPGYQGQPGERDGNGVIEGTDTGYNNSGTCEHHGETALFWRDLSYAQLIEGSFTTGNALTGTLPTTVTGSNIPLFFPQAKLGGLYVYVYSGTTVKPSAGNYTTIQNNVNYFGLSSVVSFDNGCTNAFYMAGTTNFGGISVEDAFTIDSKIDDGFPQTGRVTAKFVNSWAGIGITWAGHSEGSWGTGVADTSATDPMADDCFNNNSVGGAQQIYSVGAHPHDPTCALSFQFQ